MIPCVMCGDPRHLHRKKLVNQTTLLVCESCWDAIRTTVLQETGMTIIEPDETEVYSFGGDTFPTPRHAEV